MTRQTITVQKQPPAVQTPQQMIMHALTTGATVETIEKLMTLQIRWEDREARKDFFRALGDFQAAQPSIIRRKNVGFENRTGGTTSYDYAPLGDIAEQIRDALHANGLSYRFEQDHSDGISVTCIVSHVGGHEERTTMKAGADASGGKNSVQAIGSTVSYLSRYTLTSALGLTTADADIDARLSDETISEDQAAALKARLQTTGSNVKSFCKMLGIENVDAMPASKYAQADSALAAKEAKAPKEGAQ